MRSNLPVTRLEFELAARGMPLPTTELSNHHADANDAFRGVGVPRRIGTRHPGPRV